MLWRLSCQPDNWSPGHEVSTWSSGLPMGWLRHAVYKSFVFFFGDFRADRLRLEVYHHDSLPSILAICVLTAAHSTTLEHAIVCLKTAQQSGGVWERHNFPPPTTDRPQTFIQSSFIQSFEEISTPSTSAMHIDFGDPAVGEESVEGGEEAVIGRAMGWRREAVTNYCRLRGGKGIGGWWNASIGRVEEARCPRCGEEEQTPDHIVFRCRKVRRVKDERGRREWAKEVGIAGTRWRQRSG